MAPSAADRTGPAVTDQDVLPEHCGAVGDGTTDDTHALQCAIDTARERGARVVLGGRTYAVSALIVGHDDATIFGPGGLRGLADTAAVVGVQGSATRPVRRVRLQGLTIDTGAAGSAVRLENAADCSVTDCDIQSFRDRSQGIRIDHGCVGDRISGNRIEATRSTELVSLVCISINAPLVDGYAGFFTPPGGSIKYLPVTTRANIVTGNSIRGGTHGVLICGASDNRIEGNTIAENGHRNINISPAGRHNLVADNRLLDAGSSAVAMAYGSSQNVVRGNLIDSQRTVPGCDRDAIHAYVSSQDNVISANRITGNFRYGVYLAVNARANRVEANHIELTPSAAVPGDFTVGVALENDWPERPLPAGARYSRQNFGSPLPLAWAYEDLTRNEIMGNHIETCSCAVYLAQFGTTCRLLNNRIADNTLGAGVECAQYVYP